jgi:hypothetical protein
MPDIKQIFRRALLTFQPAMDRIVFAINDFPFVSS